MTSPHTDVLGSEFTAETIPLRADDEGPVDATLIRRLPVRQSHRAVLYIHGFVDYFFQVHLAEQWAAHDYDFYALDLRKYGRSLHEYQSANYVDDMATYDEELDEAIRIIRSEGHDVVVVLAHSTGGLIVPLWADRRRGRGLIDAIVLNSPFFDLNGTKFERGPLTTVMEYLGRIAPKLKISTLKSHYAKSIHADSGGEWDFDLKWKPYNGFPARAGWVRALRRAQATLNAGLRIDVPILVCASARSGDAKKATPALTNADCVLNVDHMVAGAPGLGPDVTIVRIDGGLHDLALSPAAVRQKFFDKVFSWCQTHVPA